MAKKPPAKPPMKSGTCPKCGGKMKNGKCTDCGYMMKK